MIVSPLLNENSQVTCCLVTVKKFSLIQPLRYFSRGVLLPPVYHNYPGSLLKIRIATLPSRSQVIRSPGVGLRKSFNKLPRRFSRALKLEVDGPGTKAQRALHDTEFAPAAASLPHTDRAHVSNTRDTRLLRAA